MITESLGSFEGKYEILEGIAEGGMGAVYKVRHRLLHEVRVIKMMRSHLVNQEASRERFYREARIAAKARHGNIAQVFDFAIDEGVAILVLEYIDGINLQDLLASHGPPSLPLALEIAQQSLRALAFVHRSGIIHRDISPDNLMLTADSDGNPRVKLIDLGLAKLSEAESQLTGTGFFLGKLRYASPEQFGDGESVEVGPRSDVYSFGLVLYELLTGRYPIRGRDWAELMAGHVSRPPIPFSESDPDGRIPERLRKIIHCSLEKQPESRFADGGVFRDQVLSIQENHPWGLAEKEESARVRQRPTPKPFSAASESDEDRLAQAFRADQSTGGHGVSEDVTGPLEPRTPETESDGGRLQEDLTAAYRTDGREEPSRETGLPSVDGVRRGNGSDAETLIRPEDEARVSGAEPPQPVEEKEPTRSELKEARSPVTKRYTPSDLEVEATITPPPSPPIPEPAPPAVERKTPPVEPDHGDLESAEATLTGAAHPTPVQEKVFAADELETAPSLSVDDFQPPDEEAVAEPVPWIPIDQEPRSGRRWWLAAAVGVLTIGLVASLQLTGTISLPGLGEDTVKPVGGDNTGTLVVNALPWARVIEVVDDEGDPVDLLGAEYTPLSLTLAPGSYRIHLENEIFGDKTVWATIEAGQTTSEVIPLAEIDQDQFLRSLLFSE